MDLKTRLNIAKGIARGLLFLHQHKVFHFHLSSKNIYLSDDLNPLIADFGFHYLKDISSVFIKYKNKNSYTSPELLKENRAIGNSSSNLENFIYSDVYSFGILLWELTTGLVPFNVSLTNVYNYVVTNGLRPEITSDINYEIASLIRNCWDDTPSKRPCFRRVLEVLENLKI